LEGTSPTSSGWLEAQKKDGIGEADEAEDRA
jgi:hypothetical protein